LAFFDPTLFSPPLKSCCTILALFLNSTRFFECCFPFPDKECFALCPSVGRHFTPFFKAPLPSMLDRVYSPARAALPLPLPHVLPAVDLLFSSTCHALLYPRPLFWRNRRLSFLKQGRNRPAFSLQSQCPGLGSSCMLSPPVFSLPLFFCNKGGIFPTW